MVDAASQTTTINASPDHCYSVILDFARYPEWADDIKEATVRARDSEGRATEVEFRASALGRSTHYILRYDHSQAPTRVGWSMLRGDIMRTIDGAYELAPSATPGATDVKYDLSIELLVPIPGFVKRRAEVRILDDALKHLKARAESK